MSVINDMLRDLEQRKAPDRSGVDTASSNGSLIETKSPTLKKYLIALVVLLLAVGVGLGSLLLRDHENTITPESPEIPFSKLTPTEAKIAFSASQPAMNSLVVAKVVKPEVAPQVIEKKQIKVASLPTETPISKVKIPASKIKIPGSKAPTEKVSSRAKATTTVRESSDVEAPSTKPLVRRKSEVSPQKRDQNMAELSRTLFQKGESRKAYRSLYEFIAKHTVDQKSRTVLISYLLQDERIAEAGDVLVTTRVELNPELRQLKARWYVAQGEHNLALHTLRESLPELHRYPEYYALLAAYYQRFGFSAKAAETYASLLEYDDESANWWAGLAIALDSSKQYEKAVNAYKQALGIPDLSPELIEYIENRLSLLTVAASR